MLRIHLKMGPSLRSKEWTCCFGLHVRTATIIIGLWHLFLNVLALCILSVIIRTNNYHLLLDDVNDDDNGNESIAPILPTPLSKVDPPYAYRDHFQQTGLRNNDADMSGLVFLCMIAVTLMLIYGAVKGKPSHLLPFFCLQIFDFAIVTLTAAGHLCYIRSMHLWIVDSQNRLPWREELLKINPKILSLFVLMGFLFFILLKLYAIGIVWRCYKCLNLRQHNIRSMVPYIIPDTHDIPNLRQEPDNLLLPGYDEAIANGIKQAPPPSYIVAISMNNKITTQPVPVESQVIEAINNSDYICLNTHSHNSCDNASNVTTESFDNVSIISNEPVTKDRERQNETSRV
ncbi:lysosomal-associated transmembrane protein 4B [Malaya genurostris]|uniref:lysosomal-associated transmembrane protein 4B n=1 Tax=Malaya genurostris TaxID=325434 RepID=UPI0026F3BD92|nr:lysosomal-associated transmembrane protein 4B [Malaya genurostris]XP_058455337.1 lysosomal-associated transmembrane protein 4B [Malaya genurostris]XP_058455338.1 lysosomal-associated transmembrane protein 4B [Malaya genurostris]